MNALDIESISVEYNRGRAVVDALSLQLSSGEIGCLIGPSGCGKTTVLRALAGFERVQGGTIRLGGRTLSSAQLHLPPERRGVGMMFQEVALFSHLDVAENIGFGLRRRSRQQREARVSEMLALVGMDELGHRYPHELSGGQQQRVALARALAPAPTLILLDEPFSNLDSATRTRLTVDVRSILKAAAQTALLVTHDEAEAATMGDWIGTMGQGRIASWQRV